MLKEFLKNKMDKKALPGRFIETLEPLIGLVDNNSSTIQHTFLPGRDYLDALKRYVLEKQGQIYTFRKKLCIRSGQGSDPPIPLEPTYHPVSFIDVEQEYWLKDLEFTTRLLQGWNLCKLADKLKGVVLLPLVPEDEKQKYIRLFVQNAPDFFSRVGNSLSLE